MTVPTNWTDLSETPSANSPPATGEEVGHNASLYLQALYAFIRMAYDGQIEILAPFNANTEKLSNLANAIDPTDIAVVGQASITWGAPSSTRALLHQPSAPVGWTVDTASDFTDCAVRLNASTGGNKTPGAVGFTGWATPVSKSVAGHPLSAAELPLHIHGIVAKGFAPPPGDGVPGFNIFSSNPQAQWGFSFQTFPNSVGSDIHSHDYSPPNLKYVDLIVAIKS